MNLSELWQNGSSDLASASGNTTSPVSCQTATKHDLNTTKTASQVIVASCTGLFYLAILTLSVLGVWIQRFARLCSSRGTFFVFLIGALLASVNVFTNADNLEVKLYFRSSIVIVIGIAFTLFGAALFFALPQEDANQPATLGRQQPSMGGVVGAITFVLFVIEVYLLVLTCRKSAEFSWDTTRIIVIIDKSAFLVQKPVQVIIYLYLRSTITRLEFGENARFYFRILSFFNLFQWVDSQVNLDSDIHLSQEPITGKPSGWFNVLTVFYKALIIDYRLLCCLLFLEHSIELQIDGLDGAPDGEGDEGHYISNMTPRDQLKRRCGFFLGFTCLTAPVFCILYYLRSLPIEPSVQIFAIVVNLVILISGVCILRRNNLEEGEIRESIGVKIMVSSNNNNLRLGVVTLS